MKLRSWTDYKKTYKQEPDIYDFARNGDLRGLFELISKYPDLDFETKNHRGYTALMLAVYHSEVDFCTALVRGGAAVDSTDPLGNSNVMAAAFKGSEEVFNLLVSNGADLSRTNNVGMTAYDWSVSFGRKNIQAIFEKEHQESINSYSKLGNISKFVRLGALAIKQRF